MAQPITLLKDFAGGQGGGASNYVTYADDLDSNFTALESTVNQLVNEVRANLASNSLFIDDMLTQNGASSVTEGVIGEHSYSTAVNGGDASQLLIEAGSALVGNIRVVSGSQETLQGSIALLGAGATNAASVFVQSDGVPQLDLTTNVPGDALEIASVNWDGTAGASGEFTGAVTQEAPIFFDGDDYAAQLSRAAKGSGPVFSAKSFRTVAARIDAIERALAGEVTDSEGDTIGSVELTELLLDDGTAGDPAVQFVSDPNTGLYRSGADQLSVSAGGTERARFSTSQLGLQPAGSAGTPVLVRIADPNTGVYFPGADRFGIATGGLLGLEVTAEQHIDSPTQPRFDFERSAVQSVTNTGALVAISFDVENTDVGGWGTVTTATLTVPTGADGFYILQGAATFAADATGERRIAITLNGAGTLLPNGQGRTRVNAAGAGTTELSTGAALALSAGDVLRLEVAHNGGAALDVTAGLGGVKVW